MAGPEESTFTPMVIPTPFGFGIAPGGLFDDERNNVFVPLEDNQQPETSQAALDTLARITTGMQIPGTAPIPGTAGPVQSGGAQASTLEAIVEFMRGLGFEPVPGQPGLFVDLEGRPVTYEDVVSGKYAQSTGATSGGGGAGTALGYAQLGESTRQFDLQFAEDVRQFGINEAYRRDQLRQQGVQFDEDIALRTGEALGFVNGAPTLARERMGEDVRQFDLSFGEGQQQFDANLAEQARQANLASATNAFGDVTRVAPQLGQLALNNAEFTRSVLREAPDYLARAFFQEGQESPLPQVRQADIINKLAGDIAKYNATLQGLNTQVGSFTPVDRSAAPPPVKPTPPPPAPALPSGGATFDAYAATPQANARAVTGEAGGVEIKNTGGTNIGFSQEVLDMMKGSPDLSKQFGFAKGGMGEGIAVVGERGPELVVEMPQGFMVLNQKQLGFNPKKLLGQVEGAQNGGIFGFEIPNIPSPGMTTQTDINTLEQRVRPPAINAILGGGMASSPRFGFDLFTPQQIRSLTPEARQALGTTLGTQFNETLENVGYAQEQRFGPTRSRGRAVQMAGFGGF